jgi:hypothetical protein
MENAKDAVSIVESSENAPGSRYSPGYIDAVFTVWYSSGKISSYKLVHRLPDPKEFGLATGYPSEPTIDSWIKNKFKERADLLDDEVSRQLADHLIAERVAMLKGHTLIAKEMIDMSLSYLRENQNKLSPNSAVRLLVEGVRIDRESSGIPRTLEKMAASPDDDIVSLIEDMLLRSSFETEPVEDDE